MAARLDVCVTRFATSSYCDQTCPIAVPFVVSSIGCEVFFVEFIPAEEIQKLLLSLLSLAGKTAQEFGVNLFP